jgi:hypothetical protein
MSFEYEFERNFQQPQFDVTQVVTTDRLTRTMNSAEWNCAIQRLNNNPNLDAACVFWRLGCPESQWALRSPNGPIMRIIINNEVVFQHPY